MDSLQQWISQWEGLIATAIAFIAVFGFLAIALFTDIFKDD